MEEKHHETEVWLRQLDKSISVQGKSKKIQQYTESSNVLYISTLFKLTFFKKRILKEYKLIILLRSFKLELVKF